MALRFSHSFQLSCKGKRERPCQIDNTPESGTPLHKALSNGRPSDVGEEDEQDEQDDDLVVVGDGLVPPAASTTRRRG